MLAGPSSRERLWEEPFSASCSFWSLPAVPDAPWAVAACLRLNSPSSLGSVSKQPSKKMTGPWVSGPSKHSTTLSWFPLQRLSPNQVTSTGSKAAGFTVVFWGDMILFPTVGSTGRGDAFHRRTGSRAGTPDTGRRAGRRGATLHRPLSVGSDLNSEAGYPPRVDQQTMTLL